MDLKDTTCGVIIAASHEAENLLPWWWYHYQRHNSYPVVFIDLGISCAARAFLQGKALIIPFSQCQDTIADPNPIIEALAKDYGDEILCVRKKWFNKPYILPLSPFTHSLWLDIDCEVRGDLSTLFSFCNNQQGIALAIDLHATLKKISLWHDKKDSHLPITFNSGVIPYRKDSPVLRHWLDECKNHSACYVGDQDALSGCIAKQKACIPLLPEMMNWSHAQGENHDALILHWHSKKGKEHIEEQTLFLHMMGWIEVL